MRGQRVAARGTAAAASVRRDTPTLGRRALVARSSRLASTSVRRTFGTTTMIEDDIRAKAIVIRAAAFAPSGKASKFPFAHTETQCIELLLCRSSDVAAAAARAGGRRTRTLSMKTAKPLLRLPFLPPTLIRPMLL